MDLDFVNTQDLINEIHKRFDGALFGGGVD